MDANNLSEESDILSVTEESYLFDELLIHVKFKDLQPKDQNEESSVVSHPNDETESPIKSTNEVVGLIDVDQDESCKKSIQEWAEELLDCLNPEKSNSFEDNLQKRLLLQKFYHLGLLAEKKLKMKQKGQSADSASDISGNSVPVVVRLGVLTMFPLIESLSGVKEANYQRLCSQTLSVVIKVMNTVGPLTLRTEPADCLDAYKDFISKQIDACESGDSPELAHAVIALVGLVMASGGASNMMHTIDALFKIFAKTKDGPLQIGHFLSKLGSFEKQCPSPLPLARGCLDQWVLERPPNDEKSIREPAYLHSSMVTDGTFFYFHSFEHGLIKVGGGKETICSHVYEANPEYLVVKRTDFPENQLLFDSHLSLIQENLYVHSPHLGDNQVIAAATKAGKRVHPIIAIVDPKNLKEKGRISLVSQAEINNCRSFSDGRFIFLMSRRGPQNSVPVPSPESTVDASALVVTLRNQLIDLAVEQGVMDREQIV